MVFFASGITTLRDFKFKKNLDVNQIIKEMEIINNYNLKFKNPAGVWGFDTINKQMLVDIHNLLTEYTDDVRLHVTRNWATVYTNTLGLYDQLLKIKEIKNIEVTEAVVVRPKDSVICARSPHSTRTYFHDKIFHSFAEKENLSKFLLGQKDIRLSPSLEKWCNVDYQRYRGVFKHFFIDHNDDRILTLVSLVTPNLIRKSVDIIKGK